MSKKVRLEDLGFLLKTKVQAKEEKIIIENKNLGVIEEEWKPKTGDSVFVVQEREGRRVDSTDSKIVDGYVYADHHMRYEITQTIYKQLYDMHKGYYHSWEGVYAISVINHFPTEEQAKVYVESLPKIKEISYKAGSDGGGSTDYNWGDGFMTL